VDADLRQPTLHSLFGLSNQAGLTDAVAGSGPPPLQDTGVPGLRLLASGPLPPSPVEVLASRGLDRVLGWLLDNEAELVLFDTAPAVALADAAVLSPRLDGVLLVVRAGRTKRDLARQAREQLERVNARLLGVVLT
jgi:non-specific protein-tyrosine kinase